MDGMVKIVLCIAHWNFVKSIDLTLHTHTHTHTHTQTHTCGDYMK